ASSGRALRGWARSFSTLRSGRRQQFVVIEDAPRRTGRPQRYVRRCLLVTQTTDRVVAPWVVGAPLRPAGRWWHHAPDRVQPLPGTRPHARDGAQQRLGVRVLGIVEDLVHTAPLHHR